MENMWFLAKVMRHTQDTDRTLLAKMLQSLSALFSVGFSWPLSGEPGHPASKAIKSISKATGFQTLDLLTFLAVLTACVGAALPKARLLCPAHTSPALHRESFNLWGLVRLRTKTDKSNSFPK